MEHADLKSGDVVQINPYSAKNIAFSGCFMVISDVKGWGVYGYIHNIGHMRNMGDVVWYRAGWEEIEHVGKASFLLQD